MSRTVITVASGKGGTGKTTVATNLAVVAAARGLKAQLLDCDVEAPNAHLFLRPIIQKHAAVTVPVPHVEEEKCDACEECGLICRFSAIVSLKTKPLVFPELCHSCGGCVRVCPQEAITERNREIGEIEAGRSRDLLYAGGRLRIGQAMSPPLIKAVKNCALEDGWVFIDAPPGNACPVIEATRGSDYVLLVTEPTPFGRSDLAIAVDTMRHLSLPFGVVINRAAPGRDIIHRYCEKQRIEIVAELPDDQRIAEAYSRGKMAAHALEEFHEIFIQLLEDLKERAGALRGDRTRNLEINKQP